MKGKYNQGLEPRVRRRGRNRGVRMTATHHNARYAKLRRQVNFRQFNVFDDIFIERRVCRLTTVGDLHIAVDLCRTGEIIIKKPRRYVRRILDTNMNEPRRGNHTIRTVIDKVIMFEIWAHRRNKDVIRMNFALCPRRKHLGESLYSAKSAFNNGCRVNIVNLATRCYWRRGSRIKLCNVLDFHWMAS